MKLSEIIREFRISNDISQREFAKRCGLSNSYISFIERETNPTTGRPMIPTLEQYKKLSDGMGITVQQLFEQLDDDSPVSFPAAKNPPAMSNTEIRLLRAYRAADPKYQDLALELLEEHPAEAQKEKTGHQAG